MKITLEQLAKSQEAERRFIPEEFSWEIINKTLLNKGFSSKRILDILSALNKTYKFENECPECGRHKKYCSCFK